MLDASLYALQSYHYDLPQHLIARYPLEKRDASKLLICKSKGRLHHAQFTDLATNLHAGDLIIFNDTQVLKSRLFGQKYTGGQVEVFVVQTNGKQGVAFIKASKSPKPGTVILIPLSAATESKYAGQVAEIQVQSKNTDGTYSITYDQDWLALFKTAGHLPLPPYIDRAAQASDDDRYQTIWANKPGAVAAPTASLHFTPAVLECLTAKGVDQARITLHVGAGTFAPVRVTDIRKHTMHAEYYDVPAATLAQIKATQARGGRIIAVGTTVLRTLETLAQNEFSQTAGETAIFIYPGFEFKMVDVLLTNFHLPESTLLMLVSAFAGKAVIELAYSAAIEQEYRFFSYGDAMLLHRDK